MTNAYHYDPQAYQNDADMGAIAHSVYSTDAGHYHCRGCGCSWKAEAVWLKWPVSFAWSWRFRKAFGRHGVEIGSDGIERPILQAVYSFGPLRVILGKKRDNPTG